MKHAAMKLEKESISYSRPLRALKYDSSVKPCYCIVYVKISPDLFLCQCVNVSTGRMTSVKGAEDNWKRSGGGGQL